MSKVFWVSIVEQNKPLPEPSPRNNSNACVCDMLRANQRNLTLFHFTYTWVTIIKCMPGGSQLDSSLMLPLWFLPTQTLFPETFQVLLGICFILI